MKLLSTKQVSTILDLPESSLRYWRCAGIGPPFVKLGGRIKYDEADVDSYVKANKRIPSVRAAQENRPLALYRRKDSDVFWYDFSVGGRRFRGSTQEGVLARARQVEAILINEAKTRGRSQGC